MNKPIELLYFKVGIAVAVKDKESGEMIAATVICLGNDNLALPAASDEERIGELLTKAQLVTEMFSPGSVEIVPLTRDEYVQWLVENQSEDQWPQEVDED